MFKVELVSVKIKCLYHFIFCSLFLRHPVFYFVHLRVCAQEITIFCDFLQVQYKHPLFNSFVKYVDGKSPIPNTDPHFGGGFPKTFGCVFRKIPTIVTCYTNVKPIYDFLAYFVLYLYIKLCLG